jgi:hypothetical protein
VPTRANWFYLPEAFTVHSKQIVVCTSVNSRSTRTNLGASAAYGALAAALDHLNKR